MKVVKEWHYLVRILDVDKSTCDAVHVTPQGSRPPFKMREVTYIIKASYPEYDLTA